MAAPNNRNTIGTSNLPQSFFNTLDFWMKLTGAQREQLSIRCMRSHPSNPSSVDDPLYKYVYHFFLNT
ncbi:hypothetical protein IAE36_002088 [Pseudomonas sp. S36]|nr:hypothetical protein [Pseudomonas sp. S36]